MSIPRRGRDPAVHAGGPAARLFPRRADRRHDRQSRRSRHHRHEQHGRGNGAPLCYINTMDETSKKRSNYLGFQHICCRNDQLYIVLHKGVFMQKRANKKDRIYEK